MAQEVQTGLTYRLFLRLLWFIIYEYFDGPRALREYISDLVPEDVIDLFPTSCHSDTAEILAAAWALAWIAQADPRLTS